MDATLPQQVIQLRCAAFGVKTLPMRELLIGSDAGCDLILDDIGIAPRHLRVQPTAAAIEVEDLARTLATRVNGQILTTASRFAYPIQIDFGTMALEIALPDDTTEMMLAANTTIGESTRYAAECEIGRGGMGRVVKVRDARLERAIAMKIVLDPNHSEDRQRFLREALVLARLQHPNIVPIHDLGQRADGAVYYTMKLVNGETLYSILNRLKEGQPATLRQYTLARLVAVFRKVCDAMAYAHEQGVLHRDLKPENIMVGAFGEVLVMDWGLAKILGDEPARAGAAPARLGSAPVEAVTLGGIPSSDSMHTLHSGDSEAPASQLTVDGWVMGTPHFMPPEQAAGRLHELDQRSDIYALGAILYNILTLRPPVSGATLEDVLKHVLSGKITPPTSYNSKVSVPAPSAANGQLKAPGHEHIALAHCPRGLVPSALSAVTMRALAAKPEARYQSVSALTADIEAYEGGFATSAEDLGALGQIWLLIKRHKVIATAAALLLVLSVGFVVALLQSERRARDNEAQATLEAGIARSAEETARLAESDARAAHAAERLAASKARAAEAKANEEAAATRLAEEKTRAALYQAQLALADSAWANGDATGLSLHLDASPIALRDQAWRYLDGRRRSYYALTPANTPTYLEVAHCPGGAGRPAQFAATTLGGDIHFFERNTGKLRRKLEMKGAVRTGLTAAPDGKVLATVLANGLSVRLLDASSGQPLKDIAAPQGMISYMYFSNDARRLLLRTYAPLGMHLLDVETGQKLWSVGGNVGVGQLDPTGKYAAIHIMGGEQEVWLLDVQTGERVRRMQVGNGFLWDLAFTSDGTRLAAGDYMGYATVWDVATGTIRSRLRAGTGRLLRLAFTRDDYLITLCETTAEWSRDLRLSAWELENGTHLDSRLYLPVGTGYLAVAPDSGHVFCGGKRGSLWRFPLGQEAYQVKGSVGGMVAAFLGERYLFAPSMTSRWAVLHDLAAAGGPQKLWQPQEQLDDMAIVNSRRDLALRLAIDHRSTVKIQRLQLDAGGVPRPGEKVACSANVRAARFAQTSDRFVCAGAYQSGFEHKVRVYDIDQAEPLFELVPPRLSRCNGIAFADEDRKIIAVYSGGGTASDVVYCWDASTHALLATLSTGAKISALDVTPDGQHFALGGQDKTIIIYRADTLAEVRRFRTHDGGITALAFHPKQPVIASCADDLSIRLWNWQKGAGIVSFLGPRRTPTALGFNADGTLLACAAVDNVTRVWKLPASLK